MDLLYNDKDVNFYVDKDFSIQYLIPVQKYVQWKLENDKWDDYNELYHASKFIETAKLLDNTWIDSHLFIKNEKIAGVLFIIGGNVSKLENEVEFESQSLLLKYFHIVEKGNGYGSLWLNSTVFPYYREKGYKQIYVNSSHADSFPFYSRLGKKISDYEQQSDNLLNKRKGSQFLIKL